MVNLTDGLFINPERESTLFKDSLSTFGIEFLQTENSRLWVLNIKYLSLFSMHVVHERPDTSSLSNKVTVNIHFLVDLPTLIG